MSAMFQAIWALLLNIVFEVLRLCQTGILHPLGGDAPFLPSLFKLADGPWLLEQDWNMYDTGEMKYFPHGESIWTIFSEGEYFRVLVLTTNPTNKIRKLFSSSLAL